MNSGKFAISVHILTLLAMADEEWMSSEYLAGSLNINPVLVRKEIINLRSHGFVLSKEGKAGGSKLAVAAERILMADVYKAVRQKDLLGRGINEPNPKCPVGLKINHHLEDLYTAAEQNLIGSLAKTSLADFCKRFE